jgi:hypothetical protein
VSWTFYNRGGYDQTQVVDFVDTPEKVFDRRPFDCRRTMRTHDELRALRLANAQDASKGTFDGFTSEEIAAYNRRMMFGENDEAFPSAAEWSRIVD